MRPIDLAIVAFMALFSIPICRAEEAKPELSKEPLTDEHIAVYRVVLEPYIRGSMPDRRLHLSDKTETLDSASFEFDAECAKGLHFINAKDAAKIIHQIENAVIFSPKIVIVNPDAQSAKITENDPHKLVTNAGNIPNDEFENKLNDSVEQAFRTGLFTLSEILFDKDHRHAMVSFSFYCGTLCGHGGTFLLKKSGKRWLIKKQCAGWIS
jgi:hypothetical protein